MLPSVEAQTVEFVHNARSSGETLKSAALRFGGFYVFIRYKYDTVEEKETLVIAGVESPERYRGRGWFWAYCTICSSLVSDGVEVESVTNRQLRDSLRRNPNFVERDDGNFAMTNRPSRLKSEPYASRFV